MEFNVATWWWIAAGLVVIAELLSGTFYLLMLSLGLAAGAMVAHLGGSWVMQLVCASVIGAGAVIAWHLKKGPKQATKNVQSNPDVNLDIGQTVWVEHWQADRTARALYRGASWSVRYAGSEMPIPGHYVIRALDGNCLVVENATQP